jgi:hypothetical protein
VKGLSRTHCHSKRIFNSAGRLSVLRVLISNILKLFFSSGKIKKQKQILAQKDAECMKLKMAYNLAPWSGCHPEKGTTVVIMCGGRPH